MPEDKLNTNADNEKIVPPVDPDTWTTGTESITEKQAAELEGLSRESTTPIPDDLSAAGANIQIEALKKQQQKE